MFKKEYGLIVFIISVSLFIKNQKSVHTWNRVQSKCCDAHWMGG